MAAVFFTAVSGELSEIAKHLGRHETSHS